MAILRRRADGAAFVRGYIPGAGGYCTWQITSEGIRVLAEHAIGYGERVPPPLIRALVDAGHLFTGESGILPSGSAEEVPDLGLAKAESPAVLADTLTETNQEGVASVLTMLREVRKLEGHNDGVTALCFSPNGQYLASGSDDGKVILWDIHSLSSVHVMSGHEYDVRCVCFMDDSLLCSGSWDETINVWDLKSGMRTIQLDHHDGAVNDLAYSPFTGQLASASSDGTIRLWHPVQGWTSRVLNAHKKGVNKVLFHDSGALLVSAGEDRAIRIWESSSGDEVEKLVGHTKGPDGLAFVDVTGDLLSVQNGPAIHVWDLESGRQSLTLDTQDYEIRAIAGLPGEQAAVSVGSGIGIWDLSEPGLGVGLVGHEGYVSAVSVSPDGRLLVTGGEDTTIRVWKI